MKRIPLIATITVILAAICVGGYAWYNYRQSSAFDEQLKMALLGVQNVRSYEAAVETSTTLSDRTLRVVGLYTLDFEAQHFGSYATTTLTVPDLPPRERTHVFTFDNLSLGDDIYVKIETDSPLLKKTILHSPEWRLFKKGAIPTQFTDIAVSGPILDNLALLSQNGAYLERDGALEETTLDGVRYHVYTLKLSDAAKNVVGGTLQSLMQRIGSGHVRVWVDDAPAVKFITIQSDNYHSTTTLLHVNTPVSIAPPMGLQ